MIMAGIVKFDGEGRYEYEWFEAFEAETILTRINFYSKNGYRFHSSLPVITGACDRDRGAESSDKTDAEIALEQIAKGVSSVLYGSIFILERGHRLEAKGDFRIAIYKGSIGLISTKKMRLKRSYYVCLAKTS